MADKRSNSTRVSCLDPKQQAIRLELKAKAKMLKEKQKEDESEQKTTTYADMLVMTSKQAKRIQSRFPELSVETVTNLILYAKQLPKESGTHIVDDLIFKAQMFQQFGITNNNTLERMYQVVSRSDRQPTVTVEQYVELLCIFISNNRISKIVFVFSVFDRYGEGEISRKRIRELVAPMIENIEVEDESEVQEYVHFMAQSLMAAMDENGDDKIQLYEFEKLVVENPLMMECLGSCLPEEDHLEKFKKKIIGRTKTEVASIFRNERRKSLRNPDTSNLNEDLYGKLYGFELELH